MPPKVDDYPSDPGDHGIMARYQSFNLSAGADAALEFLEALYVLHDSFEKAYKGYITLMKLLGCMFEENGVVFRDEDDLSDKEGDYVGFIVKNIDWVLPQLYDAMECQYVIVQPVTENPFRTFRRPSVPMLTRNGFIKFVIVNYLDRAGRGDYRPHNILFAITEKYRLLVPGTSRPVMPIDDRKQVEKNFRDLATELHIPLDRIIRQIRGFKETPPPPPPQSSSQSQQQPQSQPRPQSQPEITDPTPLPPKKKRTSSMNNPGSITGGIGGSSRVYAGSDGVSRNIGGPPAYEQPPMSEYSRYRSDYSTKSYRRSPSPDEGLRREQERERERERERELRERERERERERDRDRDGYGKGSSPTTARKDREREFRERERDRERELRELGEREFREREREREGGYKLNPKPTYFSPPPPPSQSQPSETSRTIAAEIRREKENLQRERERVQREKEKMQREREKLELRAAEKELEDMEEHYQRVAKEREYKNEVEYVSAQKRGMEAAARSAEESAERMRQIGLDDYYERRYRY
ncbi:hypothetical protein TWF730_001528 [Orbilia blumenaviensis]|uniref:DUF7514 domain-containing protein n=1 Tax=Orbilia blumenaviensis TaxID=1796055 RepID=A0AAV9UIP1_9PEZI